MNRVGAILVATVLMLFAPGCRSTQYAGDPMDPYREYAPPPPTIEDVLHGVADVALAVLFIWAAVDHHGHYYHSPHHSSRHSYHGHHHGHHYYPGGHR